jgi:hypothetical protein
VDCQNSLKYTCGTVQHKGQSVDRVDIEMQRVAVLSHVKASSAPPSLSSSGARRIPWHGGKISSNKEEALRKFYERKLRAGDRLAAQQIEAMQETCTRTRSGHLVLQLCALTYSHDGT